MKHESIADLFRALGDPIRIVILVMLSEGERTVAEVAALLRVPEPEAAAQLRLLRQYGLVASRREGGKLYYRVGDEPALSLLALAREMAVRMKPTGGPPGNVSFSV